MNLFNMQTRRWWHLNREPTYKELSFKDFILGRIDMHEVLEDEKSACENGETPLTYLNWRFTYHVCNVSVLRNAKWYNSFAVLVWCYNELIFLPLDGIYLLIIRPFFKLIDRVFGNINGTAVMEYVTKYCPLMAFIMFWSSLFLGASMVAAMVGTFKQFARIGLTYLTGGVS